MSPVSDEICSYPQSGLLETSFAFTLISGQIMRMYKFRLNLVTAWLNQTIC